MTIQTDSEVKKQAEELFAEFGLTMTAAINIFLSQSINMQTIPFEYPLESIQMDNKSENHYINAVENSEQNLLELFGEIRFADGYDYKSLREGR